jgi:4,5-DOPA dioxygenase extradiol
MPQPKAILSIYPRRGTRAAQWHFDIGRRMAPLRDEGVLILGTGNIVHNLYVYACEASAPPMPWAENFERYTRELMQAGDYLSPIDYEAGR